MAVGFVASATSGSQASVASFGIGTLGTGARAGIVFVCTHGTGDLITGVTWNSVAMNRLFRASDTDTEPGSTVAYFLDNVTNGTITVSRTNNAVVTVGYAASISALRVTRAIQTIARAVATQNTDADTTSSGTGASGEVAVDDGSPGTSSMRFAAAYTGAASPVASGTNSTTLQSLDSTALGSSFVRETTAGQGSRSVGFATGTTDDWALVAVAVREEPALSPAPGAASLAATGSTPTVATPVQSSPTVAALTATGATPTVAVTNNVLSVPDAVALVTALSTPTVATPVASTPGLVALTVTGATPAVATPIATAPGLVALVTTGSVPAVVTPVSTAPTAASVAVTGSTSVLDTGLSPSLVTLVSAFGTPTVSTPVATAPDRVDIAFDLATPEVSLSVVSSPPLVALHFTMATPIVDAGSSNNITSEPSAASLTASGSVPRIGLRVIPGGLALTTTRGTPVVSVTSSAAPNPAPRILHLVGKKPIVVVSGQKVPIGAWEPERIIRKITPHPAAAAIGLVGAMPRVVVGDDADVLAILGLIA